MSQTGGILVIDKPGGMTSSRVDRICKKTLGASKVGHIGTLDPFATGVLLVAVNSGTKAIPHINCRSKVYEFEVRFGQRTNTGDRTGAIIEESDRIPTAHEVLNILPSFRGRLLQTPHPFSAVKINGKKAYEIARRGDIPPLKSRVVTVFELDLIGDSRFRAIVSPGTYIRVLAEDMAKAVGTCGHVTSLRRLADGKFSVRDAITLDVLMESLDNRFGFMIPIGDVLDDIPVVSVANRDAGSLVFGREVVGPSLADGVYLAKAEDGFLGMVKSENGALHLERLFIKGGN